MVITAEQLKQTNLIFAEHQKLSKENVLLKKKIDVQQEMINNYQQIDSLRIIKEQDYQNTIFNLNTEIKRKSKSSVKKGILIGGVIGISLTSILFLSLR